LDDLKLSVEFIKGLWESDLSDPTLGLPVEAVDHLRSPSRAPPGLGINEDTRLAICLYLESPSDALYKTTRAAVMQRYQDSNIPSYYRSKRLVAELTGVESVVHDMCINSCIAYTGPFLGLDSCPTCSEPRYDQFRVEITSGKEKVARQQFHTIPIGPQLQALYRDPQSATYAHYLCQERSHILQEIEENGCLEEYNDVLHGKDLIEVFRDGRIGEDDIVLMFSIDGAQLYAKKASACWIYIWVLFNLAPERRYKKKHCTHQWIHTWSKQPQES